MFPLSHTYVATKVTGRVNPLLVLGSILPDIASTALPEITRDQIHNAPNELSEYLVKNYPELADLGLAVRLHSQINKGADFYCDNPEVGYAKIEGAKIAAEVATLFGIPNGEASLGVAHNFIELAIDLHLYRDCREVWVVYKEGIEKVKAGLPVIADSLVSYLGLDQVAILRGLSNLVDRLRSDNFTSAEKAIRNMAVPLAKAKYDKDLSLDEALRIMRKASAITKPTYRAFLDNTVLEVGKNILGTDCVPN